VPTTNEVWTSGDAYEPYVGRWSRLVARTFLEWLAVPPGKRWVDVGCGTGALSATVLEIAEPAEAVGIDASPGYVAYAERAIVSPRARFQVADALGLPFADGRYQAAVTGLVLNFVPDPARMVAEMARVTEPGGVVAAYVWDYAGEMQLMRRFWDVAVALDPTAASLDEGRRFPLCRPEPLAELFQAAGLDQVEVRAIDVPTVFRDFDDYWSPFLGGQGSAPGYAMALDEERRAALRGHLRARLPTDADGAIHLTARAWAVRGRR
jgi:SAM-dependent methyltransferase